MENKFTVDYFLKKFEAIPEELWMVKYFSDGTRCCAQGHCMTKELTQRIRDGYKSTVSDEAPKQPEWQGLLLIFSNGGLLGDARQVIAKINNGNDPNYQQPTPKQRILAALADIKKLQEKETPKQEPEYRTVVIDTKVKELTREPIYQS